jgi:excisionase family DNA binding protein
MQKVQPISTGVVIAPADILTPDELAARLKVSRSWVYEKMRSRSENPLPVFRIGKYVRFSWVAVSGWLQSTVPARKRRAA